MNMRRMSRGLVAGVLLLAVARWAGAEPNFDTIEGELQKRFTPQKPTVSLVYTVAYRFLYIQMLRLAEARIDTTEGLWQLEDGRSVPAVMISVALDSRPFTKPAEKNRVNLNDRTTSILTMPDLKTLHYVRRSDEDMAPLFQKRRVNHRVQSYDLESLPLRYFSHDYITGQSSTNLNGAAELIRQGEEVSDLLKIGAEVYSDKRPMLKTDSGVRIHVNIDGQVQPFAIVTRKARIPLSLLDGRMDTLRLDVSLAPEGTGKGGRMTIWTVSLKDLAHRLQNAALIDISEKTLDWSMAPLQADYDLMLGSIRCTLQRVDVATPPMPGRYRW